jgi:hypothetical protein
MTDAREDLPGLDEAELVDEVGAAVGSEYHALEAAMIAAVALELRRGTGDPMAERRLASQGQRMVNQVDPDRLAVAAVGAAARAGADAASADARPSTGRRVPVRVSMRVLRETDSLARDLSATLASLGPQASNWMPRAYRAASFMLSTQDAARGIAERYLARGVPGKRYSDGRWMPIGSYAEMVARTITHQASVVSRTLTQSELGLSFVSIVTAFDACATCAQNRGKVWSLDGTPAGLHVLESVTDGTPVTIEVAGPLADASSGSHFRGPNCRCQIATVHPGLRIMTGPPHDPFAEKQRDRQRSLERDIRRWKAREAAALDDLSAATARRRTAAAQKRMREFLAESGRNRRPYREQLDWALGPALPSVVPTPVGAGR